MLLEALGTAALKSSRSIEGVPLGCESLACSVGICMVSMPE